MNSLISAIEEGWGWKVGTPIAVLDTNSFGNALFQHSNGTYWRIVPEELECVCVADTAEALATLRASPNFIDDWKMAKTVARAEKFLGPLAEGRCYYLVMPGVLGGKY